MLLTPCIFTDQTHNTQPTNAPLRLLVDYRVFDTKCIKYKLKSTYNPVIYILYFTNFLSV
jgi:hypothetical protein